MICNGAGAPLQIMRVSELLRYKFDYLVEMPIIRSIQLYGQHTQFSDPITTEY